MKNDIRIRSESCFG